MKIEINVLRLAIAAISILALLMAACGGGSSGDDDGDDLPEDTSNGQIDQTNDTGSDPAFPRLSGNWDEPGVTRGYIHFKFIGTDEDSGEDIYEIFDYNTTRGFAALMGTGTVTVDAEGNGYMGGTDTSTCSYRYGGQISFSSASRFSAIRNCLSPSGEIVGPDVNIVYERRGGAASSPGTGPTVPLHASNVSNFFVGVVRGSGAQRAAAERALQETAASGQQVIDCQYGPTNPEEQTGYLSYGFWYQGVPDNIDELLSIAGDSGAPEPVSRLGRNSIDDCPESWKEGEAAWRQGR
ncbi:MAG: hypothetical protein IIC91_15225 [Chloroflexi bacterium]|nr:hypothetical protein [Chloroflexota bacterium]